MVVWGRNWWKFGEVSCTKFQVLLMFFIYNVKKGSVGKRWSDALGIGKQEGRNRSQWLKTWAWYSWKLNGHVLAQAENIGPENHEAENVKCLHRMKTLGLKFMKLKKVSAYTLRCWCIGFYFCILFATLGHQRDHSLDYIFLPLDHAHHFSRERLSAGFFQ